MKDYVGRKIRGFRFEDGTDGVDWVDGMKAYKDGTDGGAWIKGMASYINKVGLVIKHAPEYVVAEFKDDNTWSYPISLIEPHLIKEECTCDKIGNNTCNYCEEIQDRAILQDAKSKMQTPEIPQLGEGVFMQVSDGGVNWYPRKVVGQLQNGDFVTASVTWKHARPIPQLPKYTHAELVEKLGEDFIYEK
jgi:hypothetical protein